ncbi:MAG: Cobalt-zinc-cadmium resistance protein CzcC, partial [Planctomycetota bacterium]
QAFRIGIERAFEDVRLARANRFSDVYLLYQPYTLQDNRPEHLPGANSWAIGVTVPLPIFNRNQGNIARARLNVDQTRLELEAIENQLKNQVFDAYEEFRISEHAINTLEQEILPASKQVRDDTYKLFAAGEQELASYLAAQREYNDAVRQYRDSMARLRRASLSINTVVGSRIVP